MTNAERSDKALAEMREKDKAQAEKEAQLAKELLAPAGAVDFGPYAVPLKNLEDLRTEREKAEAAVPYVPKTPEQLNAEAIDAKLANWFSYHPPLDEATRKKYEEIRAAGLVFARLIVKNTPFCADQTSAIRHIRVAVMEANAAIACDGK